MSHYGWRNGRLRPPTDCGAIRASPTTTCCVRLTIRTPSCVSTPKRRALTPSRSSSLLARGEESAAELAVLEIDRYFATSGVTTGFHALSFMEERGRHGGGIHCRHDAPVEAGAGAKRELFV
jgi:hypothetical protein